MKRTPRSTRRRRQQALTTEVARAFFVDAVELLRVGGFCEKSTASGACCCILKASS